MKKNIILFLTFLPTFLFAKDFVNPELEAAARGAIPESVRTAAQLKYTRHDKSDNEYEFVFIDNEKTIYKVEIDGLSKTVKELEIKTRKNSLSKNVKLSTAEIEAIILRKFPDARNIKIKLDREHNGKCKYEAEFFTDNCKVELDLNPEIGEICKEEIKYF